MKRTIGTDHDLVTTARVLGFLAALTALAAGGCADRTDGAPLTPLSAGLGAGADAEAGPDGAPTPDEPSPAADEAPRYTYVACLADPHIVEPDGRAANHLRQLGVNLAAVPYGLSGVFAAGDIVLRLPYDTLQAYHDDPQDRFDVAEEIFAHYPAPVYPAVGNHDLEIGRIDPAITWQLFDEHFGVEPYYAVDLGTWKFIVLNNFLGETQDPQHPRYDLQAGSLGAEQTAWFEDQLADGRPAVVMLHFPLLLMQDLPAILERHTDTVRLVLTGHSHAWLNLSDNYAVPNMILGASHDDPDSFLILELDNELETWRIVDWDRFHWGTSFASPWGAE